MVGERFEHGTYTDERFQICAKGVMPFLMAWYYEYLVLLAMKTKITYLENFLNHDICTCVL